MNVIYKKVSDLIPYAGNPRKNDHVVSEAAAIIKRFGFRVPALIRGDNEVIDGHLRLKAARLLKMAEVPCVIVDDLSDADIRALRISVNKLAEKADWDFELLDVELEGLKELGFDIEELGFDSYDKASHKKDVSEDEPPEHLANQVANPGDMWLLGDHRLLCGDSTKSNDVERLLGNRNPILMVTDPPYGVEYDADWRNKTMRSDGSRIGGRAIGKVVNDDRPDWTEAWSLFCGDIAYVWHAGLFSHVVAESLIKCDFELRSQIIWSKDHFAIGRGDYHWKHEPCWYAVRRGKPGRATGDRTKTTVWEIGKPVKSETGHSTQKPVECMARPMRNHDATEVYDPFLGSGTTLIAAEQLGLKCYGIEINPQYCDVIIKRWENLTGRQAALEDND